jgi:hypothetical protein
MQCPLPARAVAAIVADNTARSSAEALPTSLCNPEIIESAYVSPGMGAFNLYPNSAPSRKRGYQEYRKATVSGGTAIFMRKKLTGEA